jgi:imidazole glycerol-phosphate synthase subunit HisF
MALPRVIPVLLLSGEGLVKTVRFDRPKYLGDPVNIVRLFNDKEADELVLLDIAATPSGRRPPFALIEKLASECFMPLCYGGGVREIGDLRTLFSIGVEKVSIGTSAMERPELVSAAAAEFGSQSVVVCLDVKRDLLGRQRVYTRGGRSKTALDPVAAAERMAAAGAGELILNSIDRDGTGAGYDLDLVKRVVQAVDVPVVACGGAATLEDFARVVHEGGASAAAAGSFFVFHGPHRAVLINYPPYEKLRALLPHA